MFYVALILAGGVGVLLRFLLGRAAYNLQLTALPLGTLLANIIGCFLIGYLSAVLVDRWQASEQIQIIVLSGFLGGFTTFSAFSLEAINMLQESGYVRVLGYIVFKVTLCIFMCFLGLALAKSQPV